MLQKTQWTMAATALAIGACFALAACPAQAQVRYHLSRGGVKSVVSTGIVAPPPSTTPAPAAGIVIPSGPTTPPPAAGIVIPTPAATTPPVKPAPPVVITPPPAPVAVVSHPTPVVAPVVTNSASQGFSIGPSLLGEQRLPLGRMVDRVPPAIIGDSGPTVQKVMAHH